MIKQISSAILEKKVFSAEMKMKCILSFSARIILTASEISPINFISAPSFKIDGHVVVERKSQF